MDKPRIFLGSSGKQEKLLQALTRGLGDVAPRRAVDDRLQSRDDDAGAPDRAHPRGRLRRLRVRPGRLDHAPRRRPHRRNTVRPRPATTSSSRPASSAASLGLRRTFILHASGAKLPTDLLGLTFVRYGDASTAAEMRNVNEKLRKAIEDEGRLSRIEGDWWQYSLTERTQREPSAVSLLRISRDRDGALEVTRPLLAGGRPAVGQVLERSGEGAEGPVGHLLLLEGRAAPGPERAAAGRDRRDPDRVRRSRRRLLHDARSRGQRADVRRVLARGARRHEHPRRWRRSAARRADRRAAAAVEGDHERLRCGDDRRLSR